MNRKSIIIIATIIAIIVAVIPIITATLLTYRHTRNVELKDLSNIVLSVKLNGEHILSEVNQSFQTISHLNPVCNEKTITSLRKLAFLHPQISSLFIANSDGQIICSNWGKSEKAMTVPGLRSSSSLFLLGPLKLPLVDKPILVLSKGGQNKMIYGAMVLPQVFFNVVSKSLEAHGAMEIINLVKNHVYAAYGKNLQLKPEHHFVSDEFSYINYAVTSGDNPVPITLAVKLNNLGHTFVVGADTDEWIAQSLWWQIVFAIFIGLLVSLSLIAFVLYITRKHLSLERELARAITRQEFEVYYQPVIDLNTKICVGVEALIRWQHKENGLIMPDIFIPLAEENGQIVDITKWLIQQSVNDLKDIMQQHRDFHLAVNLSAKFFENDDILHILTEICSETKIDPHQFIIELTERELIHEDNEFAINLMHRLRALNISLALDDFGTGYSSYSYLRLFPFDYLKIDRQFIAAIGTGAITEHLVDSIIDIAQKLKLNIIAEGLETKEQIAYLRSKNVVLIQGWYYAKPLPLNEFIKFYAEHASCSP